jgi:hypothetical protein
LTLLPAASAVVSFWSSKKKLKGTKKENKKLHEPTPPTF